MQCGSVKIRFLLYTSLRSSSLNWRYTWIYFIQMTTVRQNILSAETSGLALLIFDNPHSMVLAVDTLGTSFCHAVLSIAPIFSHGRTEAALRCFFIATGALGSSAP